MRPPCEHVTSTEPRRMYRARALVKKERKAPRQACLLACSGRGKRRRGGAGEVFDVGVGGRGPPGKGERGRRDGGLARGHLYDMCGERLVMLGELVMRHSKEIAWLQTHTRSCCLQAR